MKVSGLFFILLMCLGSCSNEDRACNDQLILFIESRFFNEENPATYPPIVIISDYSDKIISQETIPFEKSTAICYRRELQPLKLSIIYHINQAGKRRYDIQTFHDFNSNNLYVHKTKDLNPDEHRAKITIHRDEHVNSFYPYTEDDFNITDSTITINKELSKPEEPFFVIFSKESETHHRYIWLENVNKETDEIFDINDTEEILNPISISYPDNDAVFERIFGRIKSSNPDFSRVYGRYYTFGIPEISMYIPLDLFSEFRKKTIVPINDRRFETDYITSTIETNYQFPDLDVELISGSYDDFVIESESDYDFYSANFSYENPDHDFLVNWGLNGKSVSHINKSKIDKAVYSYISERHSLFNPSFFELTEYEISKYDDDMHYDQFVEIKMSKEYGDYFYPNWTPFVTEEKLVVEIE